MKSEFKNIVSKLSELSKSELVELRNIIDALLFGDDAEEIKAIPLRAIKPGKGQAGHIERKKIRGYGPYLYLRYRSGGKLKSVYIGKAKNN